MLSTWGFSFPCFLTCFHSFLATCLTQFIYFIKPGMLPGVQQQKLSYINYFRKVLPIAVCFSCALLTGNTAYQYISLGYIQMIKAVTPVPLLILYFLAGREKPSYLQFFIVCTISLGVMISSVGEMQFSWIGFTIQVMFSSSFLCFVCR